MIHRLRSRDESGFTLIEMLISVLITSMIIGPLVGIIYIGILVPAQEQSRVADTESAQLFASYFSNDVQSTNTVATTGACSGTPAANTVLLVLGWTDKRYDSVSNSVVSTTKTVSYDLDANGTQMYRRSCDSAGSSDVLTVLTSLAPGTPPTFTCDGGSCGAAGLPRVISVQATETGNSQAPSPYTFTYTATRRNT